MKKAYYASHSVAGYSEGRVVVLDDTDERERGLAESGYFVQLVTPDWEKVFDGAAESPDRAR